MLKLYLPTPNLMRGFIMSLTNIAALILPRAVQFTRRLSNSSIDKMFHASSRSDTPEFPKEEEYKPPYGSKLEAFRNWADNVFNPPTQHSGGASTKKYGIKEPVVVYHPPSDFSETEDQALQLSRETESNGLLAMDNIIILT